jgi:DNA-binding CsgD family transcriptional regulator
MPEQFTLPNGAPLTSRESDVLQWMLAGETTKATATRLGISPKTVETYRSRLRAKMNAHNTVELIKLALQAGVK